jgi:hypothetical protein
MKTNLFTLKRLFFLFALTGSSFFLTAQKMQISNTNAKGYSHVGGVGIHVGEGGTSSTYTITLPFYATSFTGNFTIVQSNPCQGNPFNMNVHNLNTGFIANNVPSNTNVTLPSTYSFPIGTTYLKVSYWCDYPNPFQGQGITSNLIKVVVIKEQDPNLNIVLTPYCHTKKNSIIYNGYIGFKATGTASNINGLELKVTNPLNLSEFYPISTWLSASPPQLNPIYFYSSNLNGTYTIRLQHKYNRIMSNVGGLSYATNATIYPIPIPNNYGWTNRVWTKTIGSCMQNIDDVKPKENFVGKSSNPKGLIEEVDRSKEHKLIVYPNPTSGTINFEPSSEDIIVKQFNVYDTTNSLILSKQINNVGKQTVDLSDLKEGIYMLQIETNKGIETTKIIKNK